MKQFKYPKLINLSIKFIEANNNAKKEELNLNLIKKYRN